MVGMHRGGVWVESWQGWSHGMDAQVRGVGGEWQRCTSERCGGVWVENGGDAQVREGGEWRGCTGEGCG